jgi:hypothetical protein
LRGRKEFLSGIGIITYPNAESALDRWESLQRVKDLNGIFYRYSDIHIPLSELDDVNGYLENLLQETNWEKGADEQISRR